MKKNIRGISLLRVSKKTLYVMSLLALVAATTMGYLLMPTFNSSSTALAQDGVKEETVTTEMLSRALDFRTATDFAVLAEKGITDNGFSKVGGDVGVMSEGAEIKGLNRNNVKGMLRSGGGVDKTKKNFSDSFSAINQLPCTEVADTNLGGRTFTPGVYCLSSADLAGQLILNADNNANGVFIFRLAGSLTAQSGSDMLLMNEASASNVFFLANDSATVAENSDFRGSILARNNINVKSSTVAGRTLSLNGTVELENSTVALQNGFLQICKTATGFVNGNSQGSGGLDGRVFTFRVGGQNFTAPVGGCTTRISTPTGPTTIEELVMNTNLAGTDARNGRFILTQVTSNVPGSINAVNLPLRTANVTVREGELNNQTVVTFNNQFAVVGFVEICKEADDPGVTGFFTFTIDGVTSGIGQPAPLAQFITPVGQCTGAIAVPTAAEGALSDLAVSNGLNDTSVNSPTATAPNLGTAASFAVLAGSTVTNTGNTVVNGNLGVSPGSAVTGFPPGMVVNGTINAANAVAAQAQSDATVAFNNLASQACDFNLSGQDLGGKTLTPGVFCFDSSAFLTGTLTLDAQGNPNAVFIFKIGSTLITASNSSVVVINGGSGCNVFFQVGSSATLGTNTQFTGNILALTSITLNTGANIVAGRALALNGAVTLDTNRVDSSSCMNQPMPTPTPVTPTPTPTPITPTPTPITPTPTPITPTPTPITPTPTPIPPTPIPPTPIPPTPIPPAPIPPAPIPPAPIPPAPIPPAPIPPAPIPPTPTQTPMQPSGPTVVVRELPRPGFIFTGAFTLPADRLINVDVANGAVTARIVEGGVSSQTTIFFRNRSEAVLKVCKVAGAGIPAGTQFLFNVFGTAAPVVPAGGLLTVGTGPVATGGNGIDIGTTGVIAGATIGVNGATATAGQVGSTQVVVTAGSCTFVSTSAVSGNTASPGPNQQFQTGSTVTVTELGIFNGDTEGVINIDGVTGSVQVLQITNLNGTASSVNIGNTATAGTATNPTLAPRSIRFTLIAGTNEVEFVNFISNPALLKICKVAGAGVTIGETFTFNVTTVGPSGANVTTTLTVRAGPAATGDVAQNGFCDFATGPFSGTGTFGTGGFFNVGSTVSITEVLAANSGITTTITSPTTGTGGLTVSGTGGVTGTLSGTGGIIFGTGGEGSIATNEIVFTNTRTVTTASPTPTATPGTVPGGGTGTPTPTQTVAPPLPGAVATPLPPAPVPPLRPGQKGKARLMSSVM